VTALYRRLSLLSFFGLMITLICWITIEEHSANFPTASLLTIALIPLLFPLRGLLHGKPYTHAWNSFLMLFYFSHAIGELYSAQDFDFYPALAVLFSSSCFISSILFIRFNAKMLDKSQN
tara:strand:+ start:816 stop:1175 length:360 start_codon:yes stop_codon:yes gene_type:complete